MAFVWQCFFEENTKNEKMQIELQCYVLRKLIGADVDALMGVKSGEKNTDFYACSLSSKTIVYKGQLMPEQVRVSASRVSKTSSPKPRPCSFLPRAHSHPDPASGDVGRRQILWGSSIQSLSLERNNLKLFQHAFGVTVSRRSVSLTLPLSPRADGTYGYRPTLHQKHRWSSTSTT